LSSTASQGGKKVITDPTAGVPSKVNMANVLAAIWIVPTAMPADVSGFDTTAGLLGFARSSQSSSRTTTARPA
jgi:hypothetical protein